MNRRFYISCAAVAAGLSLIGTIVAQVQVPGNEPDSAIRENTEGNCPMSGKKDRPGREFRGNRGGKCCPGDQGKDECRRPGMRRSGQDDRMGKCGKPDGCPMMERGRGHHMAGRGVALEMLKQKYPAEVAEIEKLREQLSPLQEQLDNKVSALMEKARADMKARHEEMAKQREELKAMVEKYRADKDEKTLAQIKEKVAAMHAVQVERRKSRLAAGEERLKKEKAELEKSTADSAQAINDKLNQIIGEK